MNTILLGPNYVQKLTAISGNVDMDKLTPFMWIAQNNEIKRILTDDLYNKILTDFENDALTGDEDKEQVELSDNSNNETITVEKKEIPLMKKENTKKGKIFPINDLVRYSLRLL